MRKKSKKVNGLGITNESTTSDSVSEEVVEEGEEILNDDEVFENVDEMEVSLCQLINETFRLDDDELFFA